MSRHIVTVHLDPTQSDALDHLAHGEPQSTALTRIARSILNDGEPFRGVGCSESTSVQRVSVSVDDALATDLRRVAGPGSLADALRGTLLASDLRTGATWSPPPLSAEEEREEAYYRRLATARTPVRQVAHGPNRLARPGTVPPAPPRAAPQRMASAPPAVVETLHHRSRPVQALHVILSDRRPFERHTPPVFATVDLLDRDDHAGLFGFLREGEHRRVLIGVDPESRELTGYTPAEATAQWAEAEVTARRVCPPGRRVTLQPTIWYLQSDAGILLIDVRAE